MIQHSPETGPASSRGNQAATKPDGGEVKEKVRDMTQQVKKTAAEAAAQAREQAAQTAQKQKEAAADRLGALAEALDQTSQSLKERDEQVVANLANSAAQGINQVSSYVRESDLSDLIGDVQGWARRHPALFLGGCFVAGAIAARFLKSSADKREKDDTPDAEYLGDDFTAGEDHTRWRAQRAGASMSDAEVTP